ncbi:unnamed protein product (macronuclear) [Paramecium tetraurelia]|uniref:Transmembrane protein n=1 Tax=Paramecium tetraurelia TaxID=5888 RepID=A0E1P9_PARTE|nr:uncharacterized protein GSPATT00022387001 [Paramecium tetraurelia]CAK89216.1 unnamed protein product [Paramecium tetraurelia]|eukprot:XP_001456613.1 hypothetical protein (macronuclear) [Paramecium tetraurelia strain d4-2]
MISTEINSNDSIVRFDQIVGQQGDQEYRSPQDVVIVQDQNQPQNSQILEIGQQILDPEQLKLKEKERMERIINIPNTIKRSLSTINEVPDQSISISPPAVHYNRKDFEDEMEEQHQKQGSQELNQQRKLKKRSKKKKKKQQQTSDFHQYFSIKGLEDPRVDCNWKLLFSYFTLIILSNIILQTLEVIRYSQSICKLEGLDNLFVYLNQLLYVFGKIGILSLNYQEFTNTSSTKPKIPLLNSTLFSSIFIVLQLPLYVFDFVLCQSRSDLFTLNQSLFLLNCLDWFIISVMSVIILLHSIIKITLKPKTWKKLKYQSIHKKQEITIILQLLVTFTQSTSTFLPAMIMENFYIFFSLLTSVYLSIRKFYFHKDPFLIRHELLNNEPTCVNQDENFHNQEKSEKLLYNCSFNIKKRIKHSPLSSFSSIQLTKTNTISRKE